MFLNDFRCTPQMIPWSYLLLFSEVQPVHFLTPKNHRGTHVLFRKLVHIFATGISEIKHLGSYNKNCKRETEMMSVRWNVFKMSRQIHAEDVKDLVLCPRCFSNLVLLGEQSFFLRVYVTFSTVFINCFIVYIGFTRNCALNSTRNEHEANMKPPSKQHNEWE